MNDYIVFYYNFATGEKLEVPCYTKTLIEACESAATYIVEVGGWEGFEMVSAFREIPECPECGRKYADHDTYCMYCGYIRYQEKRGY